MANSRTQIQIAARGIQHAVWQGEFYPDDLPQDWRLTYYSNEFRALVVPAAEWVLAQEDELAQWLADTDEAFSFYLEVTELQLDWWGFAEKAELLGSQLGGILLRPEQWLADSAGLADALDAATSIAPVCVLLPDDQVLGSQDETLLTEYGVELAWQPASRAGVGRVDASNAPPWRGDGALLVVWITGDMTCSPRQWREIISAALRRVNQFSPGEHVILLMFNGEAPDTDGMRNAAMIGDLLASPVSD